MRVSVFGIGYVGAVISACLCDSAHEVIAVDKDPIKVTCLNEGRAPIVEKDLDLLISQYAQKGTLKATMDAQDAIDQSDISLICVGTPSLPDGSLDLKYVETVCGEIGAAIKNKNSFHTVVLRSTMLPGSAIDICKPILEKSSGKTAGIDFGFGNNPEFLREGSAIEDYNNPPKIVVGANDKKSANIIMSLYDNIDAPRVITEINIAEGVKYTDNAWHAMKIGFANEIGNILSDCGLDSHKVMDIFCLDTKLNISKAYLKPGFAFGGSCLPKDVHAIRAKGREKGLETPIFDSLMTANDNQIMRAFEKIKQSGAKNIALLGLSFKAGTDDLRESPLVTLAEQLLSHDFNVKIYDPNVYNARQTQGSNQNYISETMAHISKYLVQTADELKEDADLFIIGHNGEDFNDIIQSVQDQNIPILGLVRLDSKIEKRNGYHGICW